jgi:hypothetical protein
MLQSLVVDPVLRFYGIIKATRLKSYVVQRAIQLTCAGLFPYWHRQAQRVGNTSRTFAISSILLG